MRRTDDDTILKMKDDGKTGREIADYFGVSPAYICKRLKRLQPLKEPESFSHLTDKQKRFVLEKAEGKSNTDAAMVAFDVTSRDSAKALGHTTMKDPDIQKAISEIMADEGLTRRHIVKKLKDLVDHPDGHISAKGIDMSSKLMDLYPKEQKVTPQIIISAEKLNLIAQTLIEIGEVEQAKRILGGFLEGNQDRDEEKTED
jgi:hypothetical protein